MTEVSPALMMQAELLPGEKLLQSFGANVLLPLHVDAGRAGAKPYVMGRSAPRKVLGMLHLTNYRLKFKPADPREPDFSILLPAIAAIRNVSFLFVRKFRLVMHDGTHIDFLRWGIPPVISALNAVATQSRGLDWNTIRRDIAATPQALGVWAITPDDTDAGAPHDGNDGGDGDQSTRNIASAG